jgi:hypothetical protein
VPTPLLDLGLHRRNTETLHRLAYLAEGMADTSQPTTADQEIRDDDGSS